METKEALTSEEMVLSGEVSSTETVLDPPGPSETPVEVVDADQVVQRIVETVQAAMEAQAVQEAQEEPEPTPEPVEEEETETAPLLVQDVDHGETSQLLSSIQEEVSRHPLMTTPFDEYTVTEGLLLLALLLFFIKYCLDSLKGVFG